MNLLRGAKDLAPKAVGDHDVIGYREAVHRM
jgi:hypothetical protein